MSSTRRAAWAAATVVVLLLAGGAVWALHTTQTPPSSAPTPTAIPSLSASPSTTATHTPTPTPSYDLGALPKVDVFAVIPALPVDDDPYGAFSGEVVRPVGDAAPVFADPGGEPVAVLPRDDPYDGTTVPVIEHRAGWVKVLLPGRAHTPSQGDAAQLTGWLRTGDVVARDLDVQIQVDISKHRIQIVRNGIIERVTGDFAWGRSETPTPHGRAFVMMVRTAPSLAYTRGHPVVYLSVQSPTLDGFGGADVAVTAFHYHDAHSGAISNGCIRVGAAAITALAALPVGTPVTVHP
ncbi:murein L,D-transpeptidase [Microbacterium protaetiae]|uniref:Murein L,D-transpeptidase n=1 Tax=Microbacterium protaetiae TaxID=2509458 RepID=A0A4P6EES6_9MICO|nr:L,D-transpeptidase [Microbacterium protaetiae]QAY58567.1 murein L,D-transpeptidase [Microbacterium protaetiae]